MAARFSTEVLDRALARKRRARERHRQAALARLLDLLAASPIALPDATIFGSILRPGAFHEQSDVDLAIPPLRLAATSSSRAIWRMGCAARSTWSIGTAATSPLPSCVTVCNGRIPLNPVPDR